MKARLNCSVPGQYPFYFDQIQSLSQIKKSKTGEDVVFGVFNTPENSITGSAVCSFSMSDIRESFDSSFKAQQDVNSNWLPLSKQQEPSPRPGLCHANSKQLDDEHLNFLKENVLMDRSVPSHSGAPHYIKTSPTERLTSIAVDPAVVTTTGSVVDVMFVGTTRGRVLKLASQIVDGEERTNLIEEIQLFPLHIPVTNILVETNTGSVVVLSEHEVKRFPLARCGSTSIRTCRDCVGLQDPYCAWNVKTQSCTEQGDSKEDSSSLLQNIGSGRHPGCPSVSLTVSGNSKEMFVVKCVQHYLQPESASN